MDYFSVIVLTIVAFIFVSDRKIKSINLLAKENNDIIKSIDSVLKDLEIYKLNTEKVDYEKFLEIIRDSKNEYILIQNDGLELNKKDIKILLANYISTEERVCGFNFLYDSEMKKLSIKSIYVDIINYLNIFNKKDISTYGVIICKKSDINTKIKKINNEIISYVPNENIKVHLKIDKTNKQKLKEMYLEKLSKGNLPIILKLFLLIICGSIITSNLIYSLLNIQENFSGFLISLLIYYCYSYIIRYVYTPIGKRRIVASYIFPIYFIIYVIVSVYIMISKCIKKVQAS